MAVLDSRVLANSARCHASCIPPGMQNAVAIYLLAEILKLTNPSAIVTPDALISGARCYNSCVPPGLEQAAIIYLLAKIQDGGGGVPPVPGADVLWIFWEASHADDNPPADATRSVMRRFLNGDPPVIWNPTLAAWL